MATVATSLKMFDQMTRPLQQVTQALNLTISAMDQMSNSANKDIKITNTLNAARVAIQKTTIGFQELANAQDKATKEQNELNNSFERGTQSAGGLTGKVKGLLGTYLGFRATKEGINATIGGAMEAQQQLFTIQGIMSNKDVGAAYFGNLQKKANDSVFAFEDFAGNARKFMQFTKNTNSLDKLANLSERLTLMDPTQGLEGAGFALKEMMSGDGVSLKERFGFGKADIEILKASKSMDEFIGKFDTLLNQKGFTESMLEQYNQSAAAQFDNFKSNFKTAMAQAGNGALEILAPVFTQLNEAFSNGSFQPFFDGLANGLVKTVEIILKLGEGISWLWGIFNEVFPVMRPIIFGVVAALAIYKGVMLASAIATGISSFANSIYAIGAYKACASLAATELATYGKISAQTVEAMATASATAAQWGFNAALLACPITWIIIGIIAIIVVIYAAVAAVNHFAGTSLSATGIICGAFMTALAFIGNLFVTLYNLVIDIIALFYNHFATFAEFFANVFNDPIGSIVRLFSGMADSVLGILEGIASAIDTVFGSNLASAVSGWRSSLDGAVKNLVGDAKVKIPRMDSTSLHMERFEYGKAYDSGYKFGENVSSKFDIGNLFDGIGRTPYGPPAPGPDLNKWNESQGPGTLSNSLDDLNKSSKGSKNHLKNIDDNMSASNEHLEMLRDLAEQDSIQNFVTLTPNVTFGDIQVREEADINKIISKIENYMENELVSSAEGVYA